MKFIEFTAILKRHKLLVVDGVLLAVLLATFSAYRTDGSTLVSRSAPVFETTAVVAVKPGAELVPSTTVAAVPAVPADAAVPGSDDPTTTAVPTPPLAPLDDTIDSRGLYYTALSLKTIVVSPGFAQAVQARVPAMDGAIAAVVALDTNTISVVVNGSSPIVAEATMSGALTELNAVVASYASSPASRYTLDSVVVSPPSAPSAVPSVKSPLTFVLVFAVAMSLVWVCVRTVDMLQQHRRRSKRVSQLKAPDFGAVPEPQPNGHHHDEPAPVITR